MSYFARSWICFVTTKVLWTLWNILPRVKSLPLQTQLFFIRLLLISCLVYLLINRASLIRIHLSFFKLQVPSQQISRKTFFGILPLGFPFRLIKMTLKEFFLSPLGKMGIPTTLEEWGSCWKRSPGQYQSHGWHRVLISTYFKRKLLLFVRPMSSFSRWRHVQNVQQS